MQAVKRLLDSDLAGEVSRAVYAVVGRSGGEPSVALLRRLEASWQQAVDSQTNPLSAIGELLYAGLRVEDELSIGGNGFPNPVALSALSAAPVMLGAGWWKQFLESHRVELD